MIETSPPSGRINSTSVVWFLLSLATLVIVGMIGTWMNDLSQRMSANEQRMNTMEQQNGTVAAQLADLREGVKGMSDKLDQLLMAKAITPPGNGR